MELAQHTLMSARHRRQILDISAAAVATRIGVTVTTYNRFERGERRPYLDQALAIAKTLGCMVEDLGRPMTMDEELALIKEKARRNGIVVDRDVHAQTNANQQTPTQTDAQPERPLTYEEEMEEARALIDSWNFDVDDDDEESIRPPS